MQTTADPKEFGAITLPAWESKAIVLQLLLLFSASIVLPSAAHALGLPVRTFLPMHWPVVLAGLCYGWRSGAIIGLSAPALSYLLSGMPPVLMLPAMTLELGVYGFIAGLSRQILKLGWFSSTLLALLAGRGFFIGYVFATGAVSSSFVNYLQTAMIPGLIGALGQVIALPLIARRWVGTRSVN